MKVWVRDLVLGLVPLAFSIISFVYAFIMQDTKASYFLIWVDIYVLLWVEISALLSLLLIIRGVRKRSQETAATALSKWVCVTLGTIVLHPFLMDYLGFMISSVLFLSVLLAFFTIGARGGAIKGKVLCEETIIWLIIAVVTVFVAQHLFGSLLGV